MVSLFYYIKTARSTLHTPSYSTHVKSYYPQNKLYPSIRHIKIRKMPRNSLGSINMINIPTATKNSANPATFFIARLHAMYSLFIICLTFLIILHHSAYLPHLLLSLFLLFLRKNDLPHQEPYLKVL